MNEKFNTPRAYMFRMRMHELLNQAVDAGAVDGEDWDPEVLGFTVFGADPILQQNPSLVTDIVGYQLEGLGVADEYLCAIARGMKDRKSAEDMFRG